MSKIKSNIEISEETYNKLKDQLNQLKNNPNDILVKLKGSVNTVEDFIGSIVESFIQSKEQLKNLEGKMEQFLEMFKGSEGFNMDDLFGDKKTEEKDQNKKEEKVKN